MILQAVYDKTIYYNPVNDYCVLRVKSSDVNIPKEARDTYPYRDRLYRFVAVGYKLPRTDKISMMLNGEWKQGKNGMQFHVDQCEDIVPRTYEGVESYLASGVIKGIGEKTAQAIMKRFGVDALDILEYDPEKLLAVRGITQAKLQEMRDSYLENKCIQNLLILLMPYHLTPAAATKIYQYLGASSVEMLQKNPYELCRVPGFGFKRVDAIALKGNCLPNALIRIQGAIFSAFDTQKEEHGHLYLQAEALKAATMKLLNEKLHPDVRVKPAEVDRAIEDMVLAGKIVRSKDRFYQKKFFAWEDETARKVACLISEPCEWVEIEPALREVRQNLGITLSQRQSEAVYTAYRHNISIITGSPGTGKTTVLKAIIEVFKLLYPKKKILLAAPTGRASRRMVESTGHQEAKTLHSALGLLADGMELRDKSEDMLDANLIIVDESSMIDMWLAYKFFSRIAATSGTKLVMVGDVDQLQSVGAGDVFRDLINCGLIPVTILDEIFRQKSGSRIAYNAKRICEENDELDYRGDDFRFVRCATQEETADILLEIYQEEVKKYGIEQVQILSPLRVMGVTATEQLNCVLRETINPAAEDSFDVRAGNKFFRAGDKVIQMKNTDKASNGDIGFIRSIQRDEKGEIAITVDFLDNRILKYKIEDMAHMELAYATTIHKAMGSEYNVVIIPIVKAHARMLNRNLIYTAITRAKQKVILVGQIGMLYMAIHKSVDKRNTALGERIKLYYKAAEAGKQHHKYLKKVS